MKIKTITKDKWTLLSQGVPSYSQIRSQKHIKIYVGETLPDINTEAYFTCDGAFSYPGSMNVYAMMPETIRDVEGNIIESIDIVVGEGEW